MTERLGLNPRLNGKRYVLQLHGELNGSTACLVLEAMYLAPAHLGEIALDITRLSRIDAFGLDVLERGVRSRARGRPVRFERGGLVA